MNKKIETFLENLGMWFGVAIGVVVCLVVLLPVVGVVGLSMYLAVDAIRGPAADLNDPWGFKQQQEQQRQERAWRHASEVSGFNQ